MKLFLFCVLCACCPAIISCHSAGKATNDLPTHFPVSAATMVFIERLKTEDPSKPSNELVIDFDLLYIGKQYYVSGMAKLNPGFSEKKMQQLKVRVNTKAGNIATLQIPVSNFHKFLQAPGIDYFEVSGKVSIQKQ